MLATISSTRSPATDLGYLLHKNPGRIHTEDLSFGKVHVFYPEADVSRCTVAVLLEVDPIALVRGEKDLPAKVDNYSSTLSSHPRSTETKLVNASLSIESDVVVRIYEHGKR